MVHDPATWTREYNTEDYPEYVASEKPDESIFEAIDHIIEKLGKDRYILGPSGDEVGMVLLGGMERGLTEYITNPGVVKAAGRHFVNKANTKCILFYP